MVKKKKIQKRVKRVKLKKTPKETISKTKIRVIGIGGGAGSIISGIASRVKKADFVVANTDARALREIDKKVKKFQFGQNLTSGLGTGMNMEVGEMAAQQEKDKIEKLFEGQDLCIIISCLGGGTGGGAGSVFAKISRNANCLTYGIFTLPFKFEGEKKQEISKEALLKIRPHLSAFSIIPNERIFQIIDKDTPLKEALSAINQKLAQNLEGLIEMIYSPGLINIDFADLKTILAGRGKLAYLNTIEIKEPHREEAIKKVISSPLYSYTIKGARGILYNIVGGRSLQLSDVSRISGIVSDLINKNAKIIFGIDQQKKYEDKIRITLLATGCSAKNEFLKKKEPKPKSSLKPRAISQLPKIDKAKPKTRISKPKTLSESKQDPKPKPESRPKPKPKPNKPKSKPKPKPPKPKIKPKSNLSKSKSKEKPSPSPLGTEPEQQKIRRNALQLRKAMEEEEKELLEKERIWETPAIFRRKINDK